jgi:hypothetical protein
MVGAAFGKGARAGGPLRETQGWRDGHLTAGGSRQTMRLNLSFISDSRDIALAGLKRRR